MFEYLVNLDYLQSIKNKLPGWKVVLQIGLKLLAVFLSIFTTRWLVNNLQTEEYATYNYILSYNAIIMGIILMGLPFIVQKVYTNQNYTGEQLKNFWTTIWVIRAASYFLGILIILVSYPLSRTSNVGYIIGLYTALFIINADFNYRSVADTLGKSWQFSLTDFFSKLVLVSLLYSSIYFGILNKFSFPLWIFILASVFSYVVGLLIDVRLMYKYTHFGRFDLTILKENIKPVLFLSVSSLLVSIYINSDKLFLGYFTGGNAIQVGSYANAYEIYEVIAIIPALTMPVLASKIKKSMNISKSRTEYIGHYWQGLIISVFLGLFLAGMLLVVSCWGLSIVDAENKYYLAINALRVLSLVVLFISPVWYLTYMIIFFDEEKQDLISNICSAICTVLMYIILISQFQLVGAAAASVISFFIDACLRGYFMHKNIQKYTKENY